MMPWHFGELRMFGYDVVMVDIPWPFKLWSERGIEKSPDAQYRCMSLEEAAALRVGDLVGAGGACFMWCTWPLLAIGAHVPIMKSWGFVPVTGGAWAKRTTGGLLRWGTGYVVRSVCEPFIIGAHPGHSLDGRACANMIETIEAKTIDGLAREHSRKPDEAYALLEKLWPNARRADLFARQRRPGWDVWGDEVDKFPPAEAEWSCAPALEVVA